METLKVTLKQHTPLIHFQPGQYGATLRASEVKPKLDRFIIAKLGNGDYEIGKIIAKDNGWLIGKGQHPALNYKMKIAPFENQEVTLRIQGPDDDGKYTTSDFPMLLSNMGGKEDKSQLTNLVLYNYVEMTIVMKNKKLGENLRELLPLFFANTNFGQRSSKGYGSFTVYKFNNEKAIMWDPTKYYTSGCPMMSFILEDNDIYNKQRKIFDTLDFYWKCMKAGINYTRQNNPAFEKRYIKSYLYYYLNNKLGNKKTELRTWEKRKIKEHFRLGRAGTNTQPNHHQPIFARALLGCPDKYSYGSREVKVEHLMNDNEKKISRIPSPIYLKPVCIGNKVRIYILFDQSIVNHLNEIDNKTFRMTYNHNRMDLDLELYLDEHNYMDFIEGYHEYLSFDKNVLDALYSGTPREEYEDIYSDKLEEESWAFMPRDYNWNDILDNRQSVTFDNV